MLWNVGKLFFFSFCIRTLSAHALILDDQNSADSLYKILRKTPQVAQMLLGALKFDVR